MKKIIFYLFRAYLFLSSIAGLILCFRFSAIKKFLWNFYILCLCLYTEIASNLVDFKESNFYKNRKGLSWSNVAVLANVWGNILPYEVSFLSVLVTETKPKIIFEFGTYNGYSTVHLCKNADKDSKIYTIDLADIDNFCKRNKLSLSEGDGDLKTVGEVKRLGGQAYYSEEITNITTLRNCFQIRLNLILARGIKR